MKPRLRRLATGEPIPDGLPLPHGVGQVSVAAVVGLLEAKGPSLSRPYSSGVVSSRHAHMRELRIQHKGGPYRVLYAFDPRRTAILLIGGCKAGDDRWYEGNVPLADRIHDEHLQTLTREDENR